MSLIVEFFIVKRVSVLLDVFVDRDVGLSGINHILLDLSRRHLLRLTIRINLPNFPLLIFVHLVIRIVFELPVGRLVSLLVRLELLFELGVADGFFAGSFL